MKKCPKGGSQVIELLLLKMGWAVLSLMEINLPDDVAQATPHVMVFIAKLPWLARYKHEPWASVFVEPLSHGFVNCISPGWDEVLIHVFVPCNNQMSNFPDFQKGRRRFIGVANR